EALGRIGPDAEAAIEPLARILESDTSDFGKLAAMALSGIGPDALAALVHAFTSPRETVRRNALWAMGETNAAGGLGAGKIRPRLADSSETVRLAAADALLKIGPASQAATPELIKTLSDSSLAVRQKVAMVLIMLGPKAKEAAEPLLHCISTAPPAEDPLLKV